MSEQTFKFFLCFFSISSFRTLEKIAVTRKLELQSSWNLVTCRPSKGDNQHQFSVQDP